MSQITKRALEQSLKNLLLNKPLNKITISDIAKDCGINRMTFYYHFKDIYDLVEWACLEDARKALEENKTYDTWQQGLIQIFHAVRENKPFIMNVYRCIDREQAEKYLKPLADNLLMGVVNECSPKITVREEDKKFIAQVYSYCFIGLLLDWIKEDMKQEPEILVNRFALVIQGDFSGALERFRVDKSLSTS
ncbi:MAG: TetR/AcrR family transcriptional regulator C-terminal domain-containing protein [Acetivibrio sp.]